MVSVIIPAYNATKYIDETIDSVLNQSFQDLEVIIVNDGSRDDTASIISKRSNIDKRVSSIHQENAGVSSARNNGIRKAKGEYLVFLDADDVLCVDCLSQRVNYLIENKNIGLVHNDMEVIDSRSKGTGEIMSGMEGDVLTDLLLWEKTVIPTPSSIMVRRQVVDDIGGFSEELSNNADQFFFFMVASKYKVGRIPKVLTKYRVHSGNMHNNIGLLERDSLRAYQLATVRGLFKSVWFKRRCFSNMYLILGANWLGAKKRWRFVKYFFKAVLSYPPNITKIIKRVLR
ncbi:MAG: glycosyltransferase [Cyclobacteriaceae bacterium]